jgi:phospholipase/carboxylesterase
MTRTNAASIEVRWLGNGQQLTDPPTLVLLHGYGSSERDLVSVLPMVEAFLPGVDAKVLAVRGSFAITGRPGRYSWFPGDVWVQPPPEQIGQVADALAAAVAEHTAAAVWLGFSQGMCAAVTVLRRHPQLVSGLVALSGFSFDVDQPGDAQLAREVAAGRGVPAFYGRDPADPAIPAFASAWALRYLRTHTALQEHSYPGMGHSLSMPEITDLTAFLGPLLRSGGADRQTGTS